MIGSDTNGREQGGERGHSMQNQKRGQEQREAPCSSPTLDLADLLRVTDPRSVRALTSVVSGLLSSVPLCLCGSILLSAVFSPSSPRRLTAPLSCIMAK